jgi:intracellular multiplication protein IcmW
MPEINLKASHEFWKRYEDPMIYRVISFMEAKENWMADGDVTVEAALEKLGNSLDGITRFELLREDLYVKVGCYLHISRVLRLLQAIDTTHPGAASRVLIYAEEKSRSNDEAASLFIRRNLVFERLRLLARVFSPQRLSLISKTLEKEDDVDEF